MLGTLPKLVDKNFVVGFIIPVLIGSLAIVTLLKDVGPFPSIYSSLFDTDSLTKLTIFVMALWVVAILLLLLNYLLYRLLEGYVGPFDRKAWREQMRCKFKEQSDRLDTTFKIITNTKVIVSGELKRDYFAEVRRFNENWPSRRRFVLPTRFGNVIRAAETYALGVYGVDSIAVWPRMQALVSKEFQALVDDARAQIDFFINVWFLSVLFVDIAVARSIYAAYATWHLPDILGAVWGFVVAAVGGVLLAWGAYELAIERAGAWGELVRSSFDLYLPALAKQLGYELPATYTERRRFWDAVNSTFLYQLPVRPEAWPKAAPVDTAGETKGSKKDQVKGEAKPDQSEAAPADQTAETTARTKDQYRGDAESGKGEARTADLVGETEQSIEDR